MRKIILHIGRHKTGTTAIQRFLCSQRELLGSHGLYYPQYGIRGFGHHNLGASLTRANLERAGESALDLMFEQLSALREEIGGLEQTLIISSEAFQQCDPAVVRAFFAGFDVEVVVYLREPVSYLVSAYAQKIHASDYTGSLEDFYQSTFSKTYLPFINDWASVFRRRLTVRVYDRVRLLDGNVVIDFCQHVLGIDAAVVSELYEPEDANPSLTSNLVEFKRFVNTHSPMPESHARMLYRALAELARTDASGPVPVSKKLIKAVNGGFSRDNRALARYWFSRRRLFSEFSQERNRHTLAADTLQDIRNSLIQAMPLLDASQPHPAETRRRANQ